MGHHGCDNELDESNERRRRRERDAAPTHFEKLLHEAITAPRLRELEWAATYVLTHKERRCRCGGHCDQCKPRREALAKLGPRTVLELVKALQARFTSA